MIAIPGNSTDLPTTLRALVSQFLNVPRDPISFTGTSPNFDTLTIDLTNATPKDNIARPSLPSGSVSRVLHSYYIRQFGVIAKPFGTPDRPMLVDSQATNVQLDIVETSDGHTALRLAAGNGRAHASLEKSVLRAVLFDEASKAAGAQGVSIKEIVPAFSNSGPRSLATDVVVKAKKGFLPTATIRITGQLSVDQNLVGKIHNLAVKGDGIGGGVAAGFIRPKLNQLEGKTHSLLALPLDAVRISDVRIHDSADNLEIDVDFTS
jgi:hypothetical protein